MMVSENGSTTEEKNGRSGICVSQVSRDHRRYRKSSYHGNDTRDRLHVKETTGPGGSTSRVSTSTSSRFGQSPSYPHYN